MPKRSAFDDGPLIPAWEARRDEPMRARLPSKDVARVVLAAASRAGFTKGHTDSNENSGFYIGTYRDKYKQFQNIPDTVLLVRWRAASQPSSASNPETRIEWATYAQGSEASRFSEPALSRVFGGALDAEVKSAERRQQPATLKGEILVPPGGERPARHSGTVLDFSTLVHMTCLGAFAERRGLLPLGRAAWGWTPNTEYGPRLALPRTEGVPSEELGILLCAPPGAGKTYLLCRWAVSALEANRNVFVIDVKGNMRPLLAEFLSQAGIKAEILHFTTAARARSDRLNLLAGITAEDADCREHLRQIAQALMPDKGFKGEESDRHTFHVRILHGALMLLKLMQYFGKFGNREADLVDLYELLEDEDNLLARIKQIERAERDVSDRRKPPRYRAQHCVLRLRRALDRGRPPGQRPLDQTYDQFMSWLLMALEPFETDTVLSERFRSFGPGREINLNQIGRVRRPQVIIFAAREDDSEIATGLLAIAVKRLEATLKARRNLPPEKLAEVLLLLDETARIAGFDAAAFVSFVRDTHIGYVLVYQHLEMIEPKEKISGVLRNIGTQIYLREVIDDDLTRLNRQLREREVRRDLVADQPGGTGPSHHPTVKDVPFVPAIAPKWLPAGRRPALVYARLQQAVFLVDLHEPGKERK